MNHIHFILLKDKEFMTELRRKLTKKNLYRLLDTTNHLGAYGEPYVDKSYSSRLNDRRHLSELNQEKTYTTSLTRETGRLGSLERENVGNKLVSPEKVLSLRRNSGDINQTSSQPLSSLFQSSTNNSDEFTRSMTKNESATKRYVSEERSLMSSSNHIATANHVTSTTTTKRAIIDNGPNVKGTFQ